VLRFRLKELIAEREFAQGRVITLVEIAEATGIHRMTLSKLSNHRGYNPTADVLDRLCDYFGCRIEQLVEHLPAQKS
jgi:DNA-binding Xre family transcriptional regulator